LRYFFIKGWVMKGRHIIGLASLVLIAGIGIRAYTSLFVVRNLVFCIDDQITCEEKHAIMNFIHGLHEHDISYSWNNILPIRQQFPFIESLQIVLLANHMLQYTIQVAKPCCMINQELVFTKNSTVVHKQVFTPLSIQSLPTVFVDEIALQKEQGLHGFQQCIAKLPDTLFVEYKVTWMNAMHVRLYDKSQPQFSIVFSTDRLPDTQILTACTAIKQDILSRNKNTGEKKRRSNVSNWAADIRFNNQIVLYAEKGDRGHG
jgi:hypothetical protein